MRTSLYTSGRQVAFWGTIYRRRSDGLRMTRSLYWDFEATCFPRVPGEREEVGWSQSEGWAGELPPIYPVPILR
jgi:hypothetical protein